MRRLAHPLALGLALAGCSSDVTELERIRSELQQEHTAKAAQLKHRVPSENLPPTPAPEQAQATMRASAAGVAVEPGDETAEAVVFRVSGSHPPEGALHALRRMGESVPALTLRSVSLFAGGWKGEVGLPRQECCEAGSPPSRRASRTLPPEAMFPSSRSRALRAEIALLESQLATQVRVLAAQSRNVPATGVPLRTELEPLELLFATDRPIFAEGEYQLTADGARVAAVLVRGRSAPEFAAAVSTRYQVSEQEPGEVVRARLRRRADP